MQHKLGGLIISTEVNYISHYSKSPVHAMLSTSFNSLPPVKSGRVLHRTARLYPIRPFRQQFSPSTPSPLFAFVPLSVHGWQQQSSLMGAGGAAWDIR